MGYGRESDRTWLRLLNAAGRIWFAIALVLSTTALFLLMGWF